ncbi:MAG: hypothetical protein RMJ19_12660 [Gemmatales bacterium]|nr:hypothetical protein [Gemmatales bacterium]MDW8176518.1 hypothetical protein [Gemmatales bacterium]
MAEPFRSLLALLRKRPVEVTALEWLELYHQLGKLVPLWLSEEAHRRVEEETGIRLFPPQLPQDRGSCWIIMAVSQPDEYPLLQPAFVLPLQWTNKAKPDRRIPEKLQALAEEVRTELAIAFGESAYRDWNLHLHPFFVSEDAPLDFSSLNDQLSFASGWLALAGGLYLAQNNGQPDEHVWVSACWCRERGILRVGHVHEKLRLAERFGVRQFFLPDEQENEVPQKYLDMVRKLPQGNNKLRAVLNCYLSALDVRPAHPAEDDASFEICAQWYMRQLFPFEHFDFYCEYLVPYLSNKLRQQLRRDYPDCRPQVLVTVLSQSWNLVPLMVRTFGVTTCFLLYTPDNSSIVENIPHVRQALYQGMSEVHVEVIPFQVNDGYQSFYQLPIWQRYPADKLGVDLTPGKKVMSLHLYSAAPQGSWMIYLDSQQRDNRPIPGKEQLLCWQRRPH